MKKKVMSLYRGKSLWHKLKFLLIIFLITTIARASPNTLLLQINIDSGHMNLHQFFDLIEKKTDFTFFFENSELDLKKTFTISAQKASLHTILEQLFRKLSLTYHFANKKIIVQPQEQSSITITGNVRNDKGIALHGATISIKGTTKGVSTDQEGSYRIKAAIGDVLVYSFLGHYNQEQKVSISKQINITLHQQNTSLDEVTLIGYGKQKTKDIASAISSIKAEEVITSNSNSIDRLLGGHIPGLYAIQMSGSPGAGAIVNIRGRTSFKGMNQPLYIIDGIPIVVEDNFPEFFNNGLGALRKTNPLELIAPSDIATIEVLKDAAAASIYGSRAANGVLLITTKRGKKKQKPMINFRYTFTNNQPIAKHQLLTAKEYKEMMITTAKSSLKIDPNDPIATLIIDPLDNTVNNDFFFNGDTNWQNEISRKNASLHTTTVDISGGGNKTNYYFSLGNTSQKGIFLGEEYDKYSVRTNFDAVISRHLTTGGGISYQTSDLNNNNLQSLDITFQTRPDMPVRNEDGTLFLINNDDWSNPLTNLDKTINIQKALNFSTNTYLSYNVFRNLTLKTTFSSTIADSQLSNYYGQNSYSYRTDDNSRVFNQTWENTLSFNKKLSLHQADILLGTTFDFRRIEANGATYSGFPSPAFYNVISLADNITRTFEHITESRLHSYFARLQYNYDSRYYISATNRIDGYSKFGKNKQWASFPSVALAWTPTNEAFFTKNNMINTIKLRFSIGRTGKANLPDFINQQFYSATISNIFTNIHDITGIALTNLSNTNIGWENTNEINYGVDVSMLQNRILLTADYFNKTSEGMIMYQKILPSTGFPYQLKNSQSTVSNKGLEIAISADVISSKAIQWNSSFNISSLKNTIENVDGSLYAGLSYRINKGISMGAITGFVSEGIFKSQKEINEHALQPGAQIGDLKFQDTNNDGQITFEDLQIIGDNIPSFFGGWNNTVRFGNFELGVNLQYSFGAMKEWAPSEAIVSSLDTKTNITREMYQNSWSSGKGDTKYPQLRFNRPRGLNTASSAIVENASFIRLKNISFTYHLPVSFLKKLSLSNAYIFTSATNLFTISPYPGIDPEGVNSSNLFMNTFNTTRDFNGYPLSRSFNWGILISI